MEYETVGQPFVEHGQACVQVRIPQPDGSNLEPIVRLDPAALAGQSDDAVAALLAEAVAAEVARHAAPAVEEPPVELTRALAQAKGVVAVAVQA